MNIHKIWWCSWNGMMYQKNYAESYTLKLDKKNNFQPEKYDNWKKQKILYFFYPMKMIIMMMMMTMLFWWRKKLMNKTKQNKKKVYGNDVFVFLKISIFPFSFFSMFFFWMILGSIFCCWNCRCCCGNQNINTDTITWTTEFTK